MQSASVAVSPFSRLVVCIGMLVVLLSFTTPALFAEPPDDPIITIEVWSELDPFVADGGVRPVPREVAVERLLDEAAYIFSGMVYGYRFLYVPADPQRKVSEEFVLKPYASIVPGDPRLRVLQTWVDHDRLFARIYYTIDPAQEGWYRGWRSTANDVSSGGGTVPFIGGPTAKPESIRNAVKMAIRNLARSREFNRPQSISGAVMIAQPPVVVIREGNYEASVSVLMQVDSIVRYDRY